MISDRKPGVITAMRTLMALLSVLVVIARLTTGTAAAASETTETIVLIRHAEKPAAGLGQLSCQGLNRALALPSVLRKAFGKPAAIFAPDPAEQKTDDGTLYDYVRPLATIEPTAIAFGLPIHADIGQSHVDDLRRELDAPAWHDAYVLVAWEHIGAMLLARTLMRENGGDPGAVPDWKDSDFDSIYVVTVRRSAAGTKADFELKHEGLDGQPTGCPGGAG